MSISRFFWLTLAVAFACATGCFFLIHNQFLHWAVPVAVCILMLTNYAKMQLCLINENWIGISFQDLFLRVPQFRKYIRNSELAVMAVASVVWVLPNVTIYLPGVLLVMVVIPVGMYSSGYYGLQSMRR